MNINMAAFCYDGSQISSEGLKKAISFCRKFGYSLTIIHMYKEVTKNYSKQIKNSFKGMP